MSILPTNHDRLAEVNLPSGPNPSGDKPKRPRKKKPNLGQIYAKSLPLEVHPLPTFQPSNPLSLLRITYTWISHLLFPPTSHPTMPYVGCFSSETRSVHVTDPKHVRALWEMGFFGKGILSRSEPSWLEREKARLRRERFGAQGKAAAEDATVARREERRLFKLERARLERERIERQRMVEEGKLDPDDLTALEDGKVADEAILSDEASTSPLRNETLADRNLTVKDNEFGEGSLKDENPSVLNYSSTEALNGTMNGNVREEGDLQGADASQHIPSQETSVQKPPEAASRDPAVMDEEDELDFDIADQEHLQLTLEEAFFLCYGLGVLSVFPSDGPNSTLVSPKTSPQPLTTSELLTLLCAHSSFPPSPQAITLDLDDQFMLNYVTYHHFRSFGWVVRPGLKFSVDYLLYNRGPVFSHAEFAVLIIPSYTHRFWNTPGGRARRRVDEQKDWVVVALRKQGPESGQEDFGALLRRHPVALGSYSR